ncbi:ABC transporter permease [Halorubellus sp. PRR65]|uniref:ABC transporter permease n=1 Tax=Halorubellus sp. PRR65 TaxID=3098148 RepID=UPI002B261299|nr:ABC transporter permease [Halorubellus sp. PRR65]
MVTGGALLTQLLNGLSVGMVYVLLAAGLSIIFGVMDVINFAHGEFYALGAYLAVGIAGAIGGASGGFWIALVVAPLIVGVVGGLTERITIRPLYGRNPLYHILLTFGLVLVIADAIELIWGTQPQNFAKPALLAGPVTIAGFQYSLYNYFVIVAGGVLALGTWLALTETRVGIIIRGGAQDRGMVRALGIDIDRYYTLVFAFGCMLAAVAGIVLGAKQEVALGMGNSIIIPAFVVVVLGGLGSFRGAVAGGLGIGIVQTLTQTYVPALTGVVVYLLMVGILLVKPQGLFGNPEWQNQGGEEGDLLTGGGDGVLDTTTRRYLAVGLVGVLALVPLGIGVVYSSYIPNSLVLNILVWALFALSLDFVMGYAGLVSLGHVLFYGVGAYATVMMSLYVTQVFWVGLLAGIVLSLAVAWFVGYLSIRVSGVYFAMITLGFAQLAYNAVTKFDATGGSDGLYTGYDPTYGIGIGEVGQVSLFGDVELFYYVVLALVVGSYLVARQMMRAPFGSVLQAIRESEDRAEFLGYDTVAYKRRAFMVSGGLAGLAGGLATVNSFGVGPSFLFWLKSGEVIVMTLLGGMGTLYGPMLGAGAFLGLKEVLLTFGESTPGLAGELLSQWEGILGLIFVVFVIYVPEGLVSLPETLRARFGAGGGGGGESVTESTDPEVGD